MVEVQVAETVAQHLEQGAIRSSSPSEACFQQWQPPELLVLDASPDLVQRSAVEVAEPSGKASSEGGEIVDPVADQMFVEQALPTTSISEVPATCKEKPYVAQFSSSKDRVLKHYLFKMQHVIGYTVEAEHLGVGKRFLHCMMQGCAFCCSGDALRAIKQVHEELIAHGAKARLCAEHLRFDETPVKMRLRDPEWPIASDSGHDAQLQPGSVILPALDKHDLSRGQNLANGKVDLVVVNGKALHFRFRLPSPMFQLWQCRDLLPRFGTLEAAIAQRHDRELYSSLHSVVASGLLLRTQGGVRSFAGKCEIHKVYGWHKSVFDQIALPLPSTAVTACAVSGPL